MHTGATARFLINGMLTDSVPIRSGIRQDYSLSPLFFRIVVELLGLNINQEFAIRGIPVPVAGGVWHTFSAFVDDSTLYLEQVHQLAPALQLVNLYGQLSGLHAQSANSQLNFIHTGVRLRHSQGVSDLQHWRTTRYLGYEVGTVKLLNLN